MKNITFYQEGMCILFQYVKILPYDPNHLQYQILQILAIHQLWKKLQSPLVEHFKFNKAFLTINIKL